MKNINTQETLTDYDQQKGSKDGARGQKKTTNIAPKASFRKNSLIKMIIMKIERKQKVNNMNRVTTIYVPLILIYNESMNGTIFTGTVFVRMTLGQVEDESQITVESKDTRNVRH